VRGGEGVIYCASQDPPKRIIPGGAMPVRWGTDHVHAAMADFEYGAGISAYVTLCGLDIPQNNFSRPRNEWRTIVAGNVDCPQCLTRLREDSR
jgi:hypothetical protein